MSERVRRQRRYSARVMDWVKRADSRVWGDMLGREEEVGFRWASSLLGDGDEGEEEMRERRAWYVL